MQQIETMCHIQTCNTIIVGSGAAGYSAAERLWQLGQHDILLLTEGKNAGTSRNTGSDKQTYYKLTLSGDGQDSYTEMAQTLFQGGSIDGDQALAEAVGSVPCFIHLAELGVPFPTNRWGEYVGYKTDHDPRDRATSAGPLTSRMMTEALERSVNQLGVPILDHHLLLQILTEQNQVQGVICLDMDLEKLVLIRCRNLILATGGPACLYADSVYPASQHGANGIAFACGAHGQNLTEWQYGIASLHPRWNVSGTYMQVLPRFFSTEQDGSDPREFLQEAFPCYEDMLNQIFLKGYQWPFDSRKALDGSSRLDLLVYQERSLRRRRVFLDYRQNPENREIVWDLLSPEASAYLRKAGALQDTPFARLSHMNQPAVDFYRSRGVNLAAEPLEIALCAQHNNGGIAVNSWWHTQVEGLFAIGEAAGTHGVYRPGGTALNAGQVGALRCARYIAANRKGDPDDLSSSNQDRLHIWKGWIAALRSRPENAQNIAAHLRRSMSDGAGAFRSLSRMEELHEQVQSLLSHFPDPIGAGSGKTGLIQALRLRDQLLTMEVYLTAMMDYAKHCQHSRGSALYQTVDGYLPHISSAVIPELFRFLPDDGSLNHQIQETIYSPEGSTTNWRPVRPIPDRSSDFFENIWRGYRENQNISDE